MRYKSFLEIPGWNILAQSYRYPYSHTIMSDHSSSLSLFMIFSIISFYSTLLSASKAIDGLLESKWSSAKTKEDPLFTNRVSCIRYCQT